MSGVIKIQLPGCHRCSSEGRWEAGSKPSHGGSAYLLGWLIQSPVLSSKENNSWALWKLGMGCSYAHPYITLFRWRMRWSRSRWLHICRGKPVFSCCQLWGVTLEQLIDKCWISMGKFGSCVSPWPRTIKHYTIICSILWFTSWLWCWKAFNLRWKLWNSLLMKWVNPISQCTPTTSSHTQM